MRRTSRWVELAVVLGVAGIVILLAMRPRPAAVPGPAATSPEPAPAASRSPDSPLEQYHACARQLEMLMADLKRRHGTDGSFPMSDGLVPMAELFSLSASYPCPAAGKPTYSATGSGGDGSRVSLADLTLFCRGRYHEAAGVPENYPEVHSVRGLNRGFDPRGLPAEGPGGATD